MQVWQSERLNCSWENKWKLDIKKSTFISETHTHALTVLCRHIRGHKHIVQSNTHSCMHVYTNMHDKQTKKNSYYQQTIHTLALTCHTHSHIHTPLQTHMSSLILNITCLEEGAQLSSSLPMALVALLSVTVLQKLLERSVTDIYGGHF